MLNMGSALIYELEDIFSGSFFFVLHMKSVKFVDCHWRVFLVSKDDTGESGAHMDFLYLLHFGFRMVLDIGLRHKLTNI